MNLKNKVKPILAASAISGLFLLNGCSVSPTINQKPDLYKVDITIYKTNTPLNEIKKETKEAISQYKNSMNLNNLYILEGNKNKIMFNYGQHKVSFNEKTKVSVYVVANHLMTLNSKGLSPFKEKFKDGEQQNRDYITENEQLKLMINNTYKNNAVTDLAYKSQKLVSLDDVSTQHIFAPIDKSKAFNFKDKLTLPMTENGTSIIKIGKYYGKTVVFTMRIQNVEKMKNKTHKEDQQNNLH